MSAYVTDYQEFLAFNSGSSIVSYFEPLECTTVGLQITKMTTGSFSAMRIESSNSNLQEMPLTGSNQNGFWCLEEGPHSASLLTASLTRASIMHNIGNVGGRFLRTVITPGAGDVFRIHWHGKGGGK